MNYKLLIGIISLGTVLYLGCEKKKLEKELKNAGLAGLVCSRAVVSAKGIQPSDIYTINYSLLEDKLVFYGPSLASIEITKGKEGIKECIRHPLAVHINSPSEIECNDEEIKRFGTIFNNYYHLLRIEKFKKRLEKEGKCQADDPLKYELDNFGRIRPKKEWPK